MNVVVLPGSWRQGSYNLSLARAAVEAAPVGCHATLASIRDIPLYDGDLEAASGIPEPVSRLKELIVAADALLLVTPEYNNSLPGTFKNTIDWLSRPTQDSAPVFADRPVGLIGATPGMGGTRLSQNAWLPVLRSLGVRLWSGNSLYVAGAGRVFDGAGTLIDAKVRELLTGYMQGFALFAGGKS